MESIKFKTYGCSNHPKELIQRICIETSCENPLLCFECLRSHDTYHKNYIISFDDFFDYSIKSYRDIDKLYIQNQTPPIEYMKLLGHEIDVEKYLAEFINEKKIDIENLFKGLESHFINMCENLKTKVLIELDNQFWNLRGNYMFFKEKLARYYRITGLEAPLSFNKKPDIVKYLNDLPTYEDFALKIAKLRDDITESKICSKSANINISSLNVILRDIAVNLAHQNSLLPLPKFIQYSDHQQVLVDVSNKLTESINNHLMLINPIEEFNIVKVALNDSRILKSYEDVLILKNWINPNRPVVFKLIYRGTRDGFSASKFHKLCDNYWPTLTLAVSEFNCVFGGYTDQSWVSINHYKKSDQSFLFSLTYNKKCKILPEKEGFAVYTHDNFLPTFGDGIDLSLIDNSDIEECHSLLGFTYEDPGNGMNDWLTGGLTFRTKEIEVFEVIM